MRTPTPIPRRTHLGATRTFTFRASSTNGLSSIQVNGDNMPQISTDLTSGTGAKTLQIGGIFPSRTASITSNTRTIRLTITFAVPVRDIIINTPRYRLYEQPVPGLAPCHRHRRHLDLRAGACPSPAGNNNGAGARTDGLRRSLSASFGAPFDHHHATRASASATAPTRTRPPATSSSASRSR